MACKICGRNSCTESFHSIEEQEKHDELFGKYEDRIEELIEKIKELEKENRILWDTLDTIQKRSVEEKLELAQ